MTIVQTLSHENDVTKSEIPHEDVSCRLNLLSVHELLSKQTSAQ